MTPHLSSHDEDDEDLYDMMMMMIRYLLMTPHLSFNDDEEEGPRALGPP